MNKPSKRMDEFLDKVDTICFQYGYEIRPTKEGLTENGKLHTISIIGVENDENYKVTCIDGDGRGK